MRSQGGMPLRPLGDPRELKRHGVDPEVTRRAARMARPYLPRLIAFLILLILSAGAAAMPPLLVGWAIDHAIRPGDLGLLWLLFGAMVAVAAVVAVLSMTERWLSSWIGEQLIFDLRRQAYRHMQAMPLAFFTRTQTGALITRLNNDVVGAQRALTGTLGGIVDNLITVVITLAIMFTIEWRITLIAVALLPGFIIPARIVGQRLQALSRESMGLNAEMNNVMTERFHVAGALLVKLFGRIDREVELFESRAEQVARIGIRTAMHGRALFAALGFIGALATALVYLVGGHLVITGALALGGVVTMGMYVGQLYGPLAQLSNARVDLMTALVSFERVFEVLDLPPAITEHEDAFELTAARGHVRFEHVWFRYPAGAGSSLESLEGPRAEHDLDASAWILHDIDLDVPPGTMVALVGPSGAGKSTLTSLVPRLYDVTEGRVLLDGHDVRELTLASVAGAVGMVTQDPHLFHVSIAENLRYARPDATDGDLEAACRAARIHDVITRLPDGYDTVVGERGYRLSGGEKQRLAIARVLLKDPAVVILDEATAHLDTESERAVQAALAEALRERTSLVIAHRLSTVVDADEIVVLDEGRIVERGTHQQLLARGGLYAELARTQLVAHEPT